MGVVSSHSADLFHFFCRSLGQTVYGPGFHHDWLMPFPLSMVKI